MYAGTQGREICPMVRGCVLENMDYGRLFMTHGLEKLCVEILGQY